MYRPNFCAECGQRITRTRWHFWTSRKFCHTCAPRFRRAQLLRFLLICASLFGFGLAAGRSMRPKPPPLIVERGPAVYAPAPGDKFQSGGQSVETQNGPVATLAPGTSGASKTGPIYGPDGSPTERPTDPEEVVSICGARTKKGTPCQRRVRGTGRCWQHKGLPAMLPPSKLIVQG